MKKKYTVFGLIALLFFAVLAFAGINDRFSLIQLMEDNYILIPEISSAPDTPQSGYGALSVRANDIYFIDDEGTETSMIAAAAGGVSDLDGAYDGGGAGAGAEIAVDSGPVILTGTHATGNTLNLTATGGTGHALAISNTGTGKDISGTAGWNISKAGLGTFASLSAFTGVGNIILDDGVTASPSLTFKDATDETAAFSKADAGVLGLTTDATDGLNVLVGNLWVGNGAAGTAAMDGEDAYIEGELEVDGACEFDGAVNVDGAADFDSTVAIAGVITLENGLTIDNAVNNSLEWNENSEEIKWTFGSNALDLVSTSGVVELSVFDNAADVVISHAADGAADDFYISQTGAQDASLFITSAGTGADALSLSATAGGIDIDTALGDMTINANAAGKNVSIGSVLGSVYIEGEEDAANAVHIIADGGTSSGLILLNDTGTGDESILLDSDVGGITINANAGSVDIEAVGAADGDIGITAGDDLVMTATGAASIDSGDWDISATGAATNMASVGFDSGTIIYHDIVQLSNANIKALRATPIELVAAQGADAFIELVSLTLVLDYGSEVLTESADNLVVEYGTSNDDVTAAIEMTGFIDQAADTIMIVGPTWPLAANAAADMLNNNLELFNTGDGEFGGNATADTTMTIHIAYRVHTAGL